MANAYKARKVYTQNSIYDSRFEYSMHSNFDGLKHHPSERIRFISEHKYAPDFKTPTGHFIECKGYLSPEDRTKYKLLKEQNPDMKLVFVFSNPKETISKASRTTYKAWATKLGFENYTIDTFPAEKYGLTHKHYEKKQPTS